MRLAIISDIHGNAVALEAVLADMQQFAVDQVICLGDIIANGPQPVEALERIQALDCPVIMGNTDDWIVNQWPDEQLDPTARQNLSPHEAIFYWDAEQLSAAHLDTMRAFVPTLNLPLGVGMDLLCFHGSPNSWRDIILSTTSEDDLGRMLSGFHAALMAGGHTHVQMLRRYQGMTIINPGSVGMPYDRPPAPGLNRTALPQAEYALLHWHEGEISIEFRRVPFEVDALLRVAFRSGMPHTSWWANNFWKRPA